MVPFTKLICHQTDNDVRFALNQHAWFDFYSVHSLKQQSAGRHVTPLGYNILIPSHPVVVLPLNAACLAEKQHIYTNFKSSV